MDASRSHQCFGSFWRFIKGKFDFNFVLSYEPTPCNDFTDKPVVSFHYKSYHALPTQE